MEFYSDHGSYFNPRKYSKSHMQMKLSSLYDSSGQLQDFSSYEYYNSPYIGQCSYLFIDKDNSQIIKMYPYDCPDRYRLNLKMFTKFQHADIPYIVPLHDCFFYDKSKDKFKSIDAYTMKFISGDAINLFSLSCDEFLVLMEKLENTLLALSQQRILVGDLKYDNILIFKDGIYLIDLDCYRNTFLSEKMVYSYNKRAMLKCINSILVYSSFREKGKTISHFIGNVPFKSFYGCAEVSLNGNSPMQLCYKKINGEIPF